MNFIEAMKIAEGVLAKYKIDQLKWWKRLDGTPMLNDLAVRFSEAFMEAATEKKNAAQRCKVGSICTPETCTCALIDDEPNVSVSTNQPVQAKALTDEQIKDAILRLDDCEVIDGNGVTQEAIAIVRALLASQPSAQPIEQTGDGCTHAGMFATDNETGFVTCVGCGELAPIDKPSAPADVAAVRDAWLPIDTAPMNGDKVLLAYQNSSGKWRRVVASYYTEEHINEHWENADECNPGWYERSEAHESAHEYVYEVEGDPIFWQPLPASPTAQPQADGETHV